MRIIFLLATASLLSLAACQGGNSTTKDLSATPSGPGLIKEAPVDSSRFTTIEWIEQTRDFGKITEGQKLEVSFRFKNTGDKPLIIESVRPSCGCTVADPPKEPVAPGAEGEIKGSFDSNGKNGDQHKTLFVIANTKGTQEHELAFTVNVQKK
jgi:hypothetical protein